MSKDKNLSPQTLLAQALGWVDKKTSALIPPIYNSVTYERDPDNSYSNGSVSYTHLRDHENRHDIV